MIRIFVGYDEREAIAFHAFNQSLIENSSDILSISPLILRALPGYQELHTDGSNSFIYSRFLTPYLNDFKGWAIFADGDMVCKADIAELWALRDSSKALLCVKHNYKTKASKKYLGNKNQDYPRKNWSSLVLWNCEHPDNRILTPEFVQNQSGSFLHRFNWLSDNVIGDLPVEWNWLAGEYPDNYEAKIIHYTLGTPCFSDYRESEMSDEWHAIYLKTQRGIDD